MQAKEEYRNLLKIREALPAAKCRENFIREMNKSRVITVVGDTGVFLQKNFDH